MWCRPNGTEATFNKAVDTERNNRVLVSSPLRERLDSGTDRRPNEGQDHTGENRGQTGNDRYETLTGEEARALRQLDTVETVEHVRCDRTGDDPPENTGISRCFAAISSAGKCRTSGATTAMVFTMMP